MTKESVATEALVDTKNEIFELQEIKLKEVIKRQEMMIKLVKDGEKSIEKFSNYNFTQKINKFNLYTEKINKIRLDMVQINYKVENLKKRICKIEDIRLKEVQDIDKMKKNQEILLNDIIATLPDEVDNKHNVLNVEQEKNVSEKDDKI